MHRDPELLPPSAAALPWIVAKVRRARRHRQDALGLGEAWLASAIEKSTSYDDQQHRRLISFDQVSEPPLELPLSLGDMAFDLRSALDNLVYALAVHQGGSEVPPRHDRIAFPVCDTVHDWRSNLKRLEALDDDAKAALLARQPLHLPPAQKERSTLRQLAKLDNINKHRRPHVVAAFPGDAISIASDGAGPVDIAIGYGVARKLLVTFNRVAREAQVDADVAFTLNLFEPEVHGTSVFIGLGDLTESMCQAVESTIEDLASLLD